VKERWLERDSAGRIDLHELDLAFKAVKLNEQRGRPLRYKPKQKTLRLLSLFGVTDSKKWKPTSRRVERIFREFLELQPALSTAASPMARSRNAHQRATVYGIRCDGGHTCKGI